MINFKRIKVAGFDAFVANGSQGDVFTIDIPDGFTREQLPNVTLHVSGAVSQSFSNYPGRSMDVLAGMTNIGGLICPDNPGRITRTVVTSAYQYYCISDRNKRQLEAQEVRLVDGQAYTVPVGWVLFLASGQLMAKSALRNAPFALDAVTDACEVVAVGDVLAACIKRP